MAQLAKVGAVWRSLGESESCDYSDASPIWLEGEVRVVTYGEK